MYTTVKISKEVKKTLDEMKLVEGETYDEIIEDLIEDHMELNPQFKKGMEQSIKEYKAGKTVSFSDIKKKLKK